MFALNLFLPRSRVDTESLLKREMLNGCEMLSVKEICKLVNSTLLPRCFDVKI